MQRSAKERKPAPTPEVAFAASLRDFRKERGLSQEELGFESGYHRTYISLLERGLQNPSLRTILSLSAALDIPAARIVADVESRLGKRWKRPPQTGAG